MRVPSGYVLRQVQTWGILVGLGVRMSPKSMQKGAVPFAVALRHRASRRRLWTRGLHDVFWLDIYGCIVLNESIVVFLEFLPH